MERYFKFAKFIFLVVLAACSSSRRPTNKYWHSGSERPYVIRGVRYYPQTHYRYSAVGYASWYGPGFHGRPTASGRKFNKNHLTAAHRTLPLPCVVIIENLRNGKRVKVIVNDRGPFVSTNKRIIDVSEAVAIKLGFRNKGTALVRVTCIPLESQNLATLWGRKSYKSKR